MNSLAESTLKKMKELDEKHRAEIEREEELRELSRKKANEIKAQYEAEIREALLGPTLREEASEAQKRADRFDNERTTLWDVISPSNVFKAIRKDGENEVGLTKQALSAKTFSDWQRDKERLAQLKAEAEEKQQLSAAYAAQKRQERAEAMSLDELNQKINAPGAGNDPAIGEYRKAYDRKKSIAETEKLPKKVLSLLDRYNEIDDAQLGNFFAKWANAASGGISMPTDNTTKEQIGKELESMGYGNYKDLAAYRAYALSQKADSYGNKQAEYWENYAKDHPVLASLSARSMAPVANITGVAGMVKNGLDGSPLLTGDVSSPEFATSHAKRSIDETVSQGFKDSKHMTAGTKAFLYQTGMSGIDSLGASLFGKAGGALLGGGAMTDAYLDAIEKGETGEQAFLSGVTAGVAETLFETISLGQLNALKEIAPKSLKDVVKNIAKSTFTNFTEEANTEIANIISDYLISGGLSDYAQQYQAYKDGGLSDGDAKKNTVVDLAKRVGEAGLGGALMGGAFGTVGSVAGKFNYEQALKQSGADVARNSGEERLLASAYELGSDANTALSGYAQSVEQNMKALEQSKKTFEESQSQANEGESTKKEGKKQEKAPEYTSKQLREIGHLQEELAIQTDDTVKQKAESAVENRLSELGEEKGKIDKAKSAIVKSITGEKLTAKDKSNIKNSKYGQRVLNEFSDAARSYANAGYSSKWAAQLQGDIEGVYDSLAEPDIEAYRSRTTEGRPTQSAEVFSAEKNADSVTDGIKMSSAATETMNKIMDEGQNADDYERSFKTYYQMGKSGYTLEEAMSSKGGAVSADFTDFQKRSAFELGQTALRTQKQVKLSTVSKIADNAVFALDENGNEVSLDEVDADGGQKMLFNRAALLRDVDAANTFISGYKPGVGLLQYSDSFRSFFNAGKQNSGKTFDSFLKENSGYKSLLSVVDEKTARSAFERGAAIVREAERKKAKVPAKKARKKEGSFVNNTTDTELNEVYEAVSKKLGIDIEKTQSLWTADEREANAQFIAKEMKVLISADAESEFTDTVHELGHLGEVRNKSAMQKVRQAILDWHNEVRGYNSTEDAISRFMQEYDCSREDAIEEYTNEALAGLFSTDEGVQDFMEWLKEDSGYTKKEKKTVLQKLVELFDRLVESIRKIIAEGELSFAAKDFAQMQADRAAQIRKMFLDALDGAEIENAEAEVKNSIRKTQNMAYDEQIERVFSKQFGRSDSLYIGKPSESLLNAGFSNAPFAMNQSDIRKSHEATAKNKNYSRHGVSRAFFEQMPSKINNAVMFIMNKNGTTVITDYQMNDRNGEKSFVALGVWHNQKMENDTVNQIKSIYPLDNLADRLLRAAESDSLIISEKKKAQTMLATVGVQSSEVSRLLELSKDSISQSNNDVKYSLKQTDSEGTELSAEQQEFFKDVDSSLRDDQGRIKPFYHGTARADRVGYFFDPERATSGPMAFFTDNKQIADNYARDKNDTSLAYDSDYDSYETQFRVNVDGESIPVSSLWYYLNVAQKNEITQKAQQLTIDDDYEDLVMKPGNKYGNGRFDIRYARGNAIQALIDSWLGDGFFIGEENRFLDVLKAVGINDVEYKDPNYREEKTYKAYLNIKNPFNTDWVDEEFIADLKDYVENTDMSIYEKESTSADMWDKNSIDISDWIERLQEDYENGTTYSWTSIPDVVTDFLKEYGGYDGIIDRGGKQGGEIHTVAIPFYSNQIKEITNKKPTAENPDIRYSRKFVDKEKKKLHNKRRAYSESDTLFMQWSNSLSTPVGERKVFKLGKNLILFEKTEDGCVELFREKAKNEVKKYERAHRKTDERIREIVGEIRPDMGRSGRNNNVHRHGGDDAGDGRQNGSERLQADTGRSSEHLLSGDSGISNITDSEKKKSSLRHSLGIADSAAEQSLVAQNEAFRRIISEQQRVLNRHFVDAQKVKTLARVIKQDYRSTIDAAELTAMLDEVYTGMANGKTISPDVVSTQMRAIAEKVVSASKNLTEPSERSKEIIKDIRSVAVRLSEAQKREVAYHYGSYNDFRRSAFGSLRIRNDGIELDSRYSELAAAYPDLFTADIAEVDQPIALFEAVKNLKNGYFDENGFDYDSAVDYLAADMYEKYFEIPESKSLEDDYRLKLNAEKVRMRKELQTAKTETKEQFEKELRRVREESSKHIAGIRAEYDEKFLRSKARYEQRVQAIADTNSRAVARNSIIRKVKRLSRILLKTSNKPGYVGEKNGEKFVIYNNIPEELRVPVASLCELFTDDNSVFEYEKLDDLRSAYGTIRANAPADETSFSGLYDEEVAEDLETLKKTIAGKRLAQLSAKELETIKKVLDHFDAMIKNETEIFVNGRTQLVSNLGEQELSDLRAKGRKKLRQYGKAEKTVDTARKFGVNNYKPIYFFDKVGGVFKVLFGDIRKGQDKYVRNIEPIKDVYQSKVKKFGVRDALRNNEAVSFTTERGEKLDLTLEQRMLIFATAKREQLSGQKSLHLMTGGVVFENQIQKSGEKTRPWKFREGDAGAHPLSLGDIMKIADSLTEKEKGFVDEMVGYLSTDVAAWGNDVSMKLYGYRKFTEKYYIPFNSAKSFGYQRFGEQGESLLRSMSFTKQTVRGAASPLVLSDFTAVWARHIERMSAYNSMVIPLENLGRVFNYKTTTDESSIGQSVASQLETAFGKDYKDYIVQFVKDVNGNVMTDDREEGYSALLRKFKKSAVFASASVAIQQPSAIMRAYAVVDPKYFLASTFDSRKSYEECKKYAPVALLKEIGGFDTVSGRNMIDYILGEEYTAKEKPKAFFTDSDYRDEVLSYLPGKADEITWAHIWNAVKREQAAKTGLRGEQLLEKAGERFSEVIERTQVYDSVLTRSANMRSKSAAMQTITAFMAEPTTTINMLTDAWENRKTDKKKFARVIASVTVATLLNSVLKSLVTAPRDDDEDKTYIEKYISQVIAGFFDDMNPLSLLPLVQDVISLMQGYDVNRSDMDLFANFVKAIQRCSSDKVPVDKKITGVLGALADFTGIPLKNIFRDIYGTKTLVRDVSSGNKTTKNGIRFALEDEMFPILRAFKFVEPSSRQERLYEAWLDKDEKTYNRLAASYKSGTQVKNALKNSIKADYLDGLISAEQAEKLLEPLFTKENEAYYEIRKWDSGEEDDESSTGDDEAFYNLSTARATEKAKEDSRKVENILSQYTDDEEEEEDEEAYAKFTYLEKAVKKGDMSAFRSEVNDLKKHGISDETIAKKVKSYLQKYDDAVYAAGEKYANGDVAALDSAASIAQKYGIEQLTVEAAIRSVASVSTGKKSIVTGTSAIMSDVHIAVGAGDGETSSRLIKEIVAGKMAEGKTEKEAYQAVRQSLNGKWRAIYLAASSSKRAEIRRNLYNTGAYASLYKLDETISKWIKNQNDETE